MAPGGEHEKCFAESQRKPSMVQYQARFRKGVVVILDAVIPCPRSWTIIVRRTFLIQRPRVMTAFPAVLARTALAPAMFGLQGRRPNLWRVTPFQFVPLRTLLFVQETTFASYRPGPLTFDPYGHRQGNRL